MNSYMAKQLIIIVYTANKNTIPLIMVKKPMTAIDTSYVCSRKLNNLIRVHKIYFNYLLAQLLGCYSFIILKHKLSTHSYCQNI